MMHIKCNMQGRNNKCIQTFSPKTSGEQQNTLET